MTDGTAQYFHVLSAGDTAHVPAVPQPLRPAGPDLSPGLVLTVLGEDGPVPISALAERTGSANSTVSGIVDRLEKLGLARRQRSETDRRVIYVCATEKYNALRAKAATDVSGYFSSLLSGMSQEDRAMIAAAFQKLDDALLQAGTEQPGP